ncbi:MAG: GTP-binding protein, partial [Lachnospiraceae bacterium]|nr:GTP-binding protein [Lachnospiraceae bacterium]
MTTINVISGFLGAGKTTLIKKLINEVYKGEKLVLIENEFGEIGIDGGFLKDAGIEITEMNSGCICCSLVGDFGTALKEVLDRFAPDRILIEPSGVGKLSDVVKAVTDIAAEADVKLASSIVVADATKCKMYMKNFGEFYNNQVEHADVIVLSRTQNMTADKLEACVKLLQEKNDKAAMITTPWDELEGAQLLAAMSGKNTFAEELMAETEVCPHCGHVHEHDHEHEHHHHHEEGEECCCGHHHEHDHEHEHHHHHEEGEECCCGHHHEHDHEHEHHHHHHEEGEECCCG